MHIIIASSWLSHDSRNLCSSVGFLPSLYVTVSWVFPSYVLVAKTTSSSWAVYQSGSSPRYHDPVSTFEIERCRSSPRSRFVFLHSASYSNVIVVRLSLPGKNSELPFFSNSTLYISWSMRHGNIHHSNLGPQSLVFLTIILFLKSLSINYSHCFFFHIQGDTSHRWKSPVDLSFGSSVILPRQ